jgi:GH15 family glucan-1,4-alpha-glucosidase
MYRDIGEYGVIGNPRTAALVARDGAIDFCCLPFFHSPAVFAALLDHEVGGRFAVTLADGEPASQRYEPGTNVLRTTIESPAGTVDVVDFMPYYVDRGELVFRDEILRLVQCTEGEPTLSVTFDPRLDFARGATALEIVEGGCRAVQGDETVTLSSPVVLERTAAGATGHRPLAEGEAVWLGVRYGDGDPFAGDLGPYDMLERTRRHWKIWSSRCIYDGPWSDAVLRSALVLKLLTYDPTGAVVAAATTSLPEVIGGTRNWDYRYTWIRDSIFSAWSFHLLDYHELGIEFLDLLELMLDPERIPPIVDVQGNPVPPEETLDHLEGYRGSRPVRIGNDAAAQTQWDSYGAMIDGAYFSHRKLGGIDWEVYEGFVRPAVDHICRVWHRPDHGIWEVRGGKRQFVNSKVWCWVVLDRGVRIAKGLGYREDVERWEPVETEIRDAILEEGWSEEREAFTITYGNDALDASVLLMPLVGFLPADHPKMERTIDAIVEELGVDPLLYRYHPGAVHSDPIQSGDSAFTTCSFWLVACLARLGRADAARELFETLVGYSNHLGLFAEELDPETGKQMGNFPQAYTHMGLINAAVELDRVLD